MNNISPRAQRRYYRRYNLISGLTALISAPLIFTGFHPLILIISFTGFLLARKASNKKWENIGYSLNDDSLLISKGYWNRKTYAVEYFRFQNLLVKESLYQRRWDMATIILDTAGNKLVNPITVDLDREKAYQLREKLHRRFKESIY